MAVEYLGDDRTGGRRDRLGGASVDGSCVVDCWGSSYGSALGIYAPLRIVERSRFCCDLEVVSICVAGILSAGADA